MPHIAIGELTCLENIGNDKTADDFRDYENSRRQQEVERTYKQMRENQTVAHVRRCREAYDKCEHMQMSIEAAIKMLDRLVDDSDPDTDVPNSLHDFQTAERIRAAWPGEEYVGRGGSFLLWGRTGGYGEIHGRVCRGNMGEQRDVALRFFIFPSIFSGTKYFQQFRTSSHDTSTVTLLNRQDWFHLVGLLHDMGKVLFFFGEEQWSVVGDTFPVGCAFSDACVLSQFFDGNPDKHNPSYSSLHGIYEPNCGFDNVLMSYGHDEYMYNFLKKNSTLPEIALYIVRYHSFYPWHTSGAYGHLANDNDHQNKKWLREFNRFDLYSKADDLPKQEEVMPYYRQLLVKYGLNGMLRW